MAEVIFKVTRSIQKKQNQHPLCWHHAIEVDEQTRTINCTKCNAVVDPFEYVLTWARDESRYEMMIDQKKREIVKLTEEFESLKKQTSYIKRKKKVSSPTKLTLVK